MVKHFRKQLRMDGYDYSSIGHYFITICINNFKYIFGEIVNNKMYLNKYGNIAKHFIYQIPKHYKNVDIDEFIIMPNHVHILIEIKEMGYATAPVSVVTEHCSVTTESKTNAHPISFRYGLISKIIKSYKEIVTKSIHRKYNDYSFQWQRSFYDKIIETEDALENIRDYIKNNIQNWKHDRNNS
jgi:putative transposase